MAKSRKLYEHIHKTLNYEGLDNPYLGIIPRSFKDRKGNDVEYYKISHSDCKTKTKIEANYYIGIDWLISNTEDKEYVYVAPKLNTKVITIFDREMEKDDDEKIENEPLMDFNEKEDFKELNYLKMYLDAATHPLILEYSKDLLFIDWDAAEIPIEHKQEDLLTPFLIVQYLNLLKQIVRKGLKKSYYKVQVNLQSRIKGKILVGKNIKTNVFKNRLTNTVCEYQEFGIDILENRFLKKVLRFICNYIANNQILFNGNENALTQIIGYCNPAFENVSNACNEHELIHLKTNVFFKEYKEAIKVGKLILKRFAYAISNTSQDKVTTPPFWIDMPRLFELYVYGKLLDVYPASEIEYHFRTYGNELDFLITNKDLPMVIDAKYKLHYDSGHIHEDMRQVAGYARLNKVYKKLGLNDNDTRLLDCLIIYPNQKGDDKILIHEQKMTSSRKISAYRNIFKLAVTLPFIDSPNKV